MVENDNQQNPSTSTHQQGAIMAMPTHEYSIAGKARRNWKFGNKLESTYSSLEKFEIAARLKDPSKPNEKKNAPNSNLSNLS